MDLVGAGATVLAAAGAMVVVPIGLLMLLSGGAAQEHDARPDPDRPHRVVAALVAAAAAASVTYFAAQRLHEPLAEMTIAAWSSFAASAAACDALTHRVPTAVVRVGSVFTTLFLLVYGHSVVTLIGLCVAGTLYLAGRCLAYVSTLGRGDARIAFLGGLIAGFAAPKGLFTALVVFAAVATLQSGWTVLRGAGHRAMIPLGPAIVASVMAAVALPLTA